jgi:hypothetical protein
MTVGAGGVRVFGENSEDGFEVVLVVICIAR